MENRKLTEKEKENIKEILNCIDEVVLDFNESSDFLFNNLQELAELFVKNHISIDIYLNNKKNYEIYKEKILSIFELQEGNINLSFDYDNSTTMETVSINDLFIYFLLNIISTRNKELYINYKIEII